MSPVSSAMSMNWSGINVSWSGRGQRTRDSKPAMWPVSSDTMGW